VGQTAPVLLHMFIQSARKCLLKMAAIKRPPSGTYRNVTGYRALVWTSRFSLQPHRQGVASNFAGGVPFSVLFEIAYISGCPGVDISEFSVYPGRGRRRCCSRPLHSLSIAIASSGVRRRRGGGVAVWEAEAWPAVAAWACARVRLCVALGTRACAALAPTVTRNGGAWVFERTLIQKSTVNIHVGCSCYIPPCYSS
jgi:hypothetical protein